MAADLNSTTLTGRLARDPELRHTKNQHPVCQVRLAFTSRRKVDGSWTDHSNFCDVIVFGKSGENVAEHLSKGDQLGVQGRLQFREWEGENGKRSTLEVVADEVLFLAKKRDNSGDSGGSNGGEDDIPF